jgi:conjugative transposon TraM protein
MKHTTKFIQDRKFYMAFPLLTTPFLVMIFWALGGGTQAPSISVEERNGLITSLPDARLDEKDIWDKLNLYERAKADSIRYEEARENDPYFDLAAFKTSQPVQDKNSDDKLIHAFPNRQRETIEPMEEKIQKKLDQLSRTLNASQHEMSHDNSPVTSVPSKLNTGSRLATEPYSDMEEMMQLIGKKNQEPDAEMEQIDGVLEKILDIQHPERVKERLQATQPTSLIKPFTVQATIEQDITLLAGEKPSQQNLAALNQDVYGDSPDTSATEDFTLQRRDHVIQNSFYGLNEPSSEQSALTSIQTRPAIQAVIHDTQELVSGSTVKLRLTEDVTIAGIALQKDHFIFGTCEINAERLQIKVSSIRSANLLIPVALSVFDLDGLQGIYVPGAISRDAAKQGSADALQSMQLMSLNPTLGAQATAAGIEAAKGFMAKKVRLIRVTVKAGYQLLLKDTNTTFN